MRQRHHTSCGRYFLFRREFVSGVDTKLQYNLTVLSSDISPSHVLLVSTGLIHTLQSLLWLSDAEHNDPKPGTFSTSISGHLERLQWPLHDPTLGRQALTHVPTHSSQSYTLQLKNATPLHESIMFLLSLSTLGRKVNSGPFYGEGLRYMLIGAGLQKFLQVLLDICPIEARALLISLDGPSGNKSYIIPSTWPNCLSPGREFLLQLGSCIKDPECPVCFKLTLNGNEGMSQSHSCGGESKKGVDNVGESPPQQQRHHHNKLMTVPNDVRAKSEKKGWGYELACRIVDIKL